MKILSIAYRNVVRNWRRTSITTFAMGFACFIMILFATLMEGMVHTSEKNAVSMNLGDIQIHAEGYRDDPDLYKRIDNPERITDKLRKTGFYAAHRLYGFGLAAAGSSSAGIQLRGIDVKNEMTVTEIHRHVMLGRWLSESDPHGIVIGKKLARTLDVKPGEEVVFIGQASDGSMANDLYTVRGILKSVGEEIDRGGVYMIEDAFRKLMVIPDGAHEIAVMRLDRSGDLDEATKKVTDIAAGHETLNWRNLRPLIARVLDLADAQMIIMILITYIAVVMIVLNSMLMSVFERIREFGIMKAIGVTPWQLIMMIYAEAIIQVIASSIFALLFGYFVTSHLQKSGIDLSAISSGATWGGVAFDPIWYAYLTKDAFGMPVIFLFLVTMVAVVYPAVKAAVIRPVKAIHHA
ncbi:MAG: ABC transporter permease [Deltaproteobacteria bacterium]|nr:ABC transporter permease [Deltaproteobacteria bacterium]